MISRLLIQSSRRFPGSRLSLARSLSTSYTGEVLTLETTPTGVAIVRLDDKASKVNTLNVQMSQEIQTMLDTVEKASDIQSVVLMSNKKNCFIAGADIAQLQACTNEAELTALSVAGQSFLSRIASSDKKFVAAIEGVCLGGGLEVALACHYRIATESKSTQLGLPEVQLGLLPGAGGTQRLPRLVGMEQAFPMLLKGGNVKPAKAKKIGLVDQLVDHYALESAAIQAAEQLIKGTLKPTTAKFKSPMAKVINQTGFAGQHLAISATKKEVAKGKMNTRFPALDKIIECVEVGMSKGMEEGLKVEAKNFGQLGMTSVSQSLVNLYFLMTENKKNKFGKPEHPVQTIGVLGAGLMGAGIAQVSAQKAKMNVLLKDREEQAAVKGLEGIRLDLETKVKRRRMSIFDRDLILSRVSPLGDDTPSMAKHLAKADLVIEAVFEDLALKHQVVRDLEKSVSPHCIIATNTSALSVAEIASVAKRPENVIGMHYFSPVPMMPLLEIICHPKTSPETASRAVDAGLRQGKSCLVVKDVPGFYVNRCLGPYIAETLALVQDGVDPKKLDDLIKDQLGFPVGPITLADEVGVDVASHVNTTLTESLGVRMGGGNAAVFDDMIAQNFLGRKSGKGFYLYDKTDKKSKTKTINPEALALMSKYLKEDLKLEDDVIQNRLLCRFINEAILCVQDEIISSPGDGDFGAIMGIGFPPHLGGPFKYVDQVGSKAFCQMMMDFSDKYGPQFTPCPLLQDMAKTNKTFYG